MGSELRQKSLLRKGFDLLRKRADYRTYVRRRRPFACLWTFLALCPMVKNAFIRQVDKKSPPVGGDFFMYLMQAGQRLPFLHSFAVYAIHPGRGGP